MDAAVRVATVDNFQGEEATVVIISLVRNNRCAPPGRDSSQVDCDVCCRFWHPLDGVNSAGRRTSQQPSGKM